MKKFLLLLILSVVKLSAYEYYFLYRAYTNIHFGKYYLYNNGNGMYRRTVSIEDGHVTSDSKVTGSDSWYSDLNAIRNSNKTLEQLENITNGNFYIGNSIFQSYYKNDVLFLNDLYSSLTNVMLNYFYNNNNFSSTNFIEYSDYELLYNSNGLVVSSIVNGQWAGLYDNSTMANSGNLYNANGSLVYVDGQKPSFFQKLWVKLSEPLMKDFMDANSGLIPLKWILAFIIIFMLVYFCIRLYKNAIGVEKWKI